MNNYIEQLVRSVLQKDSLEECTLEELKKLADDHPYFGAAQLLLAKKLQVEKSEDYSAQVEKTSLFFNNPFWLDHLLDEKGKVEIVREDSIGETKVNVEKEIETETRIENTDFIDESPAPAKERLVSADESAPRKEEPVYQEPLPIPAKKTGPFRANTDLLFEPYHTVDYFASQGIRFKEEEKPADKFGQQLKSFTEWLKTLKRLPVSDIIKNAEPVAEEKIDKLAEESLTEKEVVTETMAEVWKKQGHPEKAIEIYNKLSLLEPSKSAYFAAKIEELGK